MDELCRLCCSSSSVDHEIFGCEGLLNLFEWMPVQVSRADGLPQRVCGTCRRRLTELHHFCNEARRVQHRLHELLCEEQGEWLVKCEPEPKPELASCTDQATQTDNSTLHLIISPNIKSELNFEQESEEKREEKKINGLSHSESDNFKKLRRLLQDDSSESDDDTPLSEFRNHNGRKKSFTENNKALKTEPESDGSDELEQDIRKPTKKVTKMPKRSHKCCICLKTCSSAINEHYREHLVESVPAAPARAPDVCPRCGQAPPGGAGGWGAGGGWAAHWRDHLRRDPLLRCAICRLAFSTVQEIRQHAESHVGEANDESTKNAFYCGKCNRKFVSLRQLARHYERSHPGSPRAGCAVCGQGPRSQTAARKHYARWHAAGARRRDQLCAQCGRGFLSNDKLLNHIRFVHDKERPHVCTKCGRGFICASSLRYHERVHSGERPFACRSCGKRFTQTSSRNLHERTKH